MTSNDPPKKTPPEVSDAATIVAPVGTHPGGPSSSESGVVGASSVRRGHETPSDGAGASVSQTFFTEETNPLFGGRYQILSLLGAGGMGTVYMAKDLELDEIVALKVLRKEALAAPGTLDMFRREVKLARLVTHPNVARTFDIGEADGQKYLTMEFVDGVSLARHLEIHGPPPIPRAIEIFSAICNGLSAAHAVGVVHRDLKPENVLVAKDGRVVITDFGVARPIESGPSTVTMGLTVGTPAYMSPEQVEARRDVDHRADVFSLGALMFETLTGSLPYAGDSALAVATARLLRPAPDVRTVRADVPTVLVDLVARCLERDRDKRLSSAKDVAARLTAITAPLVAPAVVPERAQGGAKAVAVLPFRTSTAPDDVLVADGLLEDLIDGLSMTTGLRVRPRSRVVGVAADADPTDIGKALGVDVIVEGSVRRAGDVLRVSARLLNVDGFQIWARRFERPAAELFALSDAIANAVSEALTVERTVPDRAQATSPVALELYLRARAESRKVFSIGVQSTNELYLEALRHAPDDPMILGGYAYVQTRAWFLGLPEARERARVAAERALAIAPHQPEARYALALLQTHAGRAVEAMAPLKVLSEQGFVPAHETLATLLNEIGLEADARHVVDRLLKIDPESAFGSFEIARMHAVKEEWDACDERIVRVHAKTTLAQGEVSAAAIRFMMWRGDLAHIRARVGSRALLSIGPISTDTLWSVLDGTGTRDKLESEFARATANGSYRRRALVHQIEAEAACALGDVDWALAALGRAIDAALIDVVWIRVCPALARLRASEGFAPRAKIVEDRAAELRRVYLGGG